MTEDRVAQAEALVRAQIEVKVKAAAVVRPLHLYVRAFKQERLLEVWGKKKDGAFALICSYPVLAASGTLGPKRKEGDSQVPEGIYSLTTMNPKSRFLLSVKVDYPNATDRKRGPAPWGDDIYIHGSNVSIGCLAIGDTATQEFFLMVKEAKGAGQSKPPINIFPCKDMDKNLPELIRTFQPDAEVIRLWQRLAKAEKQFPK